MVRSDANRAKKYENKLNGEVAKNRVEEYGVTQKSNFKMSVAEQVRIERIVKSYMRANSLKSIDTNYYILFAKNMLKNTDEEANFEFNKWALRGLNWSHLRNIGRIVNNRRLDLREVCKTPGNVLYLSAFRGKGTKVKDLSGFGNNGTIIGATWTSKGVLGSALTFDGTDDYVDCGNDASLNITNAITIEAWVYVNDKNTGQGMVAHKYYNPYEFIIQNGAFHLNIKDEDGAVWYLDSTACIIEGEWQHMVGVWEKNTGIGRFYRNGLHVGSKQGPKKSLKIESANHVYIGSRYQTVVCFNGTIDEVRIYNRALSAEEIKQHYESEKPLFL